MDPVLRGFHVNLLPILTGQIKARACDWAVEGKGGAGGFRVGEERKERDKWSRTTWPGESANCKEFHSWGIE